MLRNWFVIQHLLSLYIYLSYSPLVIIRDTLELGNYYIFSIICTKWNHWLKITRMRSKIWQSLLGMWQNHQIRCVDYCCNKYLDQDYKLMYLDVLYFGDRPLTHQSVSSVSTKRQKLTMLISFSLPSMIEIFFTNSWSEAKTLLSVE